MENLKYTNEFLKNLEEIVSKNAKDNFTTLQKIKKTLTKISNKTAEKQILQNIKTHSNEEIFQSQIDESPKSYQIFWTEKNSKTIIISLTKNT